MVELLRLHEPHCFGTLIKRYKRFLADVRLDSGEEITAHCPNPGRMLSCSEPGSRVRLSLFENTTRKYPYRLDLVYNGDCWVGVNPNLANDIVASALDQHILLPDLDSSVWKREVKYAESHRIDFYYDSNQTVYLEVKSVTYKYDGVGYFPDAVSKRASQHLMALEQMVKAGNQAIVVYCIQREDVTSVLPASHIDHKYLEAVDSAKKSGVRFLQLPVFFNDEGTAVFCESSTVPPN